MLEPGKGRWELATNDQRRSVRRTKQACSTTRGLPTTVAFRTFPRKVPRLAGPVLRFTGCGWSERWSESRRKEDRSSMPAPVTNQRARGCCCVDLIYYLASSWWTNEEHRQDHVVPTRMFSMEMDLRELYWRVLYSRIIIREL